METASGTSMVDISNNHKTIDYIFARMSSHRAIPR